VRVVAALALVVASTGLGSVTAAAPGPAQAVESLPPPISQCATVMLSPPARVRPTLTICLPS